MAGSPQIFILYKEIISYSIWKAQWSEIQEKEECLFCKFYSVQWSRKQIWIQGWQIEKEEPWILAWHLTSPALPCAVPSHSVFAIPPTVARQAPPSLGFSRQEYWSGLLRPPPGDFPDLGIKPTSLELQVDCLLSEPPGKPIDNANWPHTKSSKTNEFIKYTG